MSNVVGTNNTIQYINDEDDLQQYNVYNFTVLVRSQVQFGGPVHFDGPVQFHSPAAAYDLLNWTHTELIGSPQHIRVHLLHHLLYDVIS